jgi:hypothetical protein
MHPIRATGAALVLMSVILPVGVQTAAALPLASAKATQPITVGAILKYVGGDRCDVWRDKCAWRWGPGTWRYGRCLWRHGC